MEWFGGKKHTKNIRELLNGALANADEGYKKAKAIRENAYHGHGPDGHSISDTDALESDEAYDKTTKELVVKLREIADMIEKKDI